MLYNYYNNKPICQIWMLSSIQNKNTIIILIKMNRQQTRNSTQPTSPQQQLQLHTHHQEYTQHHDHGHENEQSQQEYKQSSIQSIWKQKQMKKRYRKQIFGQHYNYDYKRPNQNKMYRLQQNKNTEIQRSNRILLQKIQAIFKRSMGKKKTKQLQISDVVSTSQLTNKTSQPHSTSHMRNLRTNINEQLESKLSNKTKNRDVSKSNRKSMFQGEIGTVNRNIQLAKMEVEAEGHYGYQEEVIDHQGRRGGDGAMNRNLVKLQQLESQMVNKRKRIQTQVTKKSPHASLKYQQAYHYQQPQQKKIQNSNRKVITSNSQNSPKLTKKEQRKLPANSNSSRIILMKSSAQIGGKHYRLQSYIEEITYILSARSLRNGQQYHQLITMPSKHYQELYKAKLYQNHENIIGQLVVEPQQGLLQIKGFRSQYRDIYDYGDVMIENVNKKKEKLPHESVNGVPDNPQQRSRSKSRDIIVHFSSYQNGDDVSDRITYANSEYNGNKIEANTYQQTPIVPIQEAQLKKLSNSRAYRKQSRNNNSRTSENIKHVTAISENNKQDEKLKQKKLIVNEFQVVVESPTQSRILKASGVSKRQIKMTNNVVSLLIEPEHQSKQVLNTKQENDKQQIKEETKNNVTNIKKKQQKQINERATAHGQQVIQKPLTSELKQIEERQLSEQISQKIGKQLKNEDNDAKKSDINNIKEEVQQEIEQSEQIRQRQSKRKLSTKKNKQQKITTFQPYSQQQYEDIQVIDDN